MPRSPEAMERRREYDRRRAAEKNKAYYAKNRERESERCKAYHHENRDDRLAKKAEYREANAEAMCEKARARRELFREEFLSRERARRAAGLDRESRRRWQAANAEREKERLARWAKEHPERMRLKNAERRARKHQATPPWADQEKIESLYAEAVRLTRETGVPHEVDHIVPLKGRNVCGLHDHTNLRVVTRAINRQKANKLEWEIAVEPVRLPNLAA